MFIILCEEEGFFFADDFFDFIEAVKRDSPIHGKRYWNKPEFAIRSINEDMYVCRLYDFIRKKVKTVRSFLQYSRHANQHAC